MINPDAGNLGGKVGFVFFGLGVPLCIAFWFLIPETKGLTFEDVSFYPWLHVLPTSSVLFPVMCGMVADAV